MKSSLNTVAGDINDGWKALNSTGDTEQDWSDQKMFQTGLLRGWHVGEFPSWAIVEYT